MPCERWCSDREKRTRPVRVDEPRGSLARPRRGPWQRGGPWGSPRSRTRPSRRRSRRSKSSELSRPPRWKKYSFVSSAVMKPKPRSAMTFLMVPVVTSTSKASRTGKERTVRSRRGRPRGTPRKATSTQNTTRALTPRSERHFLAWAGREGRVGVALVILDPRLPLPGPRGARDRPGSPVFVSDRR